MSLNLKLGLDIGPHAEGGLLTFRDGNLALEYTLRVPLQLITICKFVII